jgi:protein tyrosine phosphatase (PTP) superfamily phosphohydrolase (DUF442 family)
MRSINFFRLTIIKSLWQVISNKVSKRPGIEGILNYLPISEAIATSGQPLADQFSHIQSQGYKIIVNLAPCNAANAIANEPEIIESLGMTYLHLPVVWENSTFIDFQQFCQILESHPGSHIFVHCAMNMRVSAFMYLYRRLYLGVSEAEAKQALEKI